MLKIANYFIAANLAVMVSHAGFGLLAATFTGMSMLFIGSWTLAQEIH